MGNIRDYSYYYCNFKSFIYNIAFIADCGNRAQFDICQRNSGKVLLVLLSFVLVLLPWESIFGYLSSVIENSYISTRLHDLSVYFSEGNITGTVSARFNVYISSFMTFIRHPFGIGAHYSYNKLENGIGYHSQILDDLARYGVFALAFLYCFLTQYFKLLKKQWVKINMEEAVFLYLSYTWAFNFKYCFSIKCRKRCYVIYSTCFT